MHSARDVIVQMGYWTQVLATETRCSLEQADSGLVQCRRRYFKASCESNNYVALARAKSEAVDNIHSFLKQNIKLSNTKRRKQWEQWENNNRSN